jgi:hypothetical protein
MEIGIGIPNCVKGTTGAQLLDWSRRADHAGFSSIATIGAVSYPSYEELTPVRRRRGGDGTGSFPAQRPHRTRPKHR